MNKKMIIATSVVLISTLNSVSGFADENSSDSIPTSETGDTLPLLDGTILTKDTGKWYDIEGSLYTDERIEQLQEAFIKAHTPPLPKVEVPTPKAIEQQVPELPEVEVPTPKAIEQQVPELPEIEVPTPKAIEQQVPSFPEVEVPTPKAIEQQVPSFPEVEIPAPKVMEQQVPELPEVEVPTPKVMEQQVPELPEVEVPTPKAIEQKVPSLSKVEVKAPKSGKPEGDNSKKEREKNAPVAIAKSKNDPDRSINLRKLTNNKKDSLDGIQSKFREVKKVHVPLVVEGNKAISNGNIKTAPLLSKPSQQDSTSLPKTGFSKLEERTSLFVTLLGFLTCVVSVYLFLLPKVKRNGK
ncbi:Uncharacterised protein [Enterococcus casseliflavus]|nr:Uncharacterised protein [Enterococcus casseliflavus]